MINQLIETKFSHDVCGKIQAGLKQLNQILPLKANQRSLSSELIQLHRDILHAYIEKGRTLSKAELALKVDDIDTAIKLLQDKDLVVFASSGEPIGAYPFTMEEREHQVIINSHKIHSMCAMDALSISPMFNTPLEIHSQCRISGAAIKIVQDGFKILNEDDLGETVFAINWNAASANTCCADSLCTEMIFIQGHTTAQKWLHEDLQNRQVYTLSEAIYFGAGFFVPLVS